MSKITAAHLLHQERCSVAEIAAALHWTVYRVRYVLRHGTPERWP